MKTEILYNYIPREGYFIDKVLPLTESKTAVFTSKYKEPSFLDILGLEKIENSMNLSKIIGFDTTNYYKCYFNLGGQFGLMHYTEEILLFNPDKLDDFEIVKISNPFKPDKHDRKTYAALASTFLIDNKLLFGLASFAHFGYPPRYLAQFEIAKSKPFFGLGNEETKVKWGQLFELPKEEFPETEFRKYKDDNDWLNIRDLVQINDIILVHSTGGLSTRLKSGNPFEFNVIAKFDKNYEWLDNIEIDKGIGRFSTDKIHFIQHPTSHKNKLLFYTTDKMEINFEISLTAKQNLGTEKPTSIRGDKLGDNIFIYNHRFLNICRQAN
jgi:hypothetical protein